MKRICVFCGANPGDRPAYAEAARALGTEVASRGFGLVYGGGNVGLMGVVADAALAAGAEVIGVIPGLLVEKEVAHDGLTDLVVVDTMHERKARMSELSDAFVALPGGYGTLEEMSEVLTWFQLGIHAKPCGLLNVEGFWDGLLALFDRARSDGFLRVEHRGILLEADDPVQLLDRLAAFEPPPIETWADLEHS